jgi:hypothetical protein
MPRYAAITVLRGEDLEIEAGKPLKEVILAV